MEVKDINKSLLGMLQMRDGAQSGTAGDINFGKFLTEFEKISVSAPKVEKEFGLAREAASSNFSKVKDNTFSDKNVSSSNSENEVKDTSSKDKSESNSVAKREDSQNTKNDRNEIKEDKSEKTQSSKEPQKQDGNNNKVQQDTVSKDSVADGTDMAEDAKNTRQEISLDVLALLNSVTIVNPVNGSQIQVSGAELAAQLSAQGIASVEISGNLDGQPMIVMPEVQTPEGSAFQEALQSLTPVADALETQSVGAGIEDSKTGDEALGLVENADVLEAQSAKLSEAVNQRKLKIEVNVKQENFADKVDGSMLKESKLSESVLSSIMNEGENANPLTESPTTTSGVNNNMQAANSANLLQNKLAGTAVAQNGNVALAADDVVAQPESNSSTLVQAGSLGHENFSGTKVAANDAQNTSFKDVYKGMSREVIDQVKVNITKSAVKGVDKVEIQLKPEDLGHIEVKMQIGKDGKLQAHIIASRPETAEMLQKDIAGLQKAFNDAGFQTDEGSLSFSFRNEGQSNQEQERNNLRNFIGQALEQDTVLDVSGSDTAYSETWNSARGLNIRV